METNPHNLSTICRRKNATRIRSFNRFLDKSKLDNALVVTDSGGVVDLYSESIWNRRAGFMARMWMRLCYELANRFHCLGRLLSRAGRLAL